MRISKEAESRQNSEDALRKNNTIFSTDSQKFNYSLRNVTKENETLTHKLDEADKAIRDAQVRKQELEAQLERSAAELEDLRLRQALEVEEKNKRLALLQQELRELQERLNESNMRANITESKSKDMQTN